MVASGVSDVKVALSLYQVVLVALSLWLGISQHGFKRLSDENTNEYVVLATVSSGFLTLGFAGKELGAYLVNVTSSPAIESAVQAVEVFMVLIAMSVIRMFLQYSRDYDANIKNVIKVMFGGLLLYTILYLSTQVF
ncbi:hypothetical protein [Haloferax prahovense]|uniref:hypothetical protein n=1 Tax=Haloferax prahovense TaxID=381852 RepID=UPI0012DF7EE7|nr:hypothetical protein [Haloferax prahovense]